MSTDSMLMDIHDELADKLKKLPGKPLFITITYKDPVTDKLEHWMAQNNDFGYEDIEKTLNHLPGQARKDFGPTENPVVIDLHQQLRAKRPKRGLRS